MKVAFLARSLGRGGAERQLLLMARELSAAHSVVVITFYGDDEQFAANDRNGLVIRAIGKRSRWDVFGFLLRFLRLIRRERPDVVYAFMGAPSIVALVARWANRGTRVVWGIRSSNVDLSRYGWFARLVRATERLLSRHADLIICNSAAGKEQALIEGFAARRIIVIPNGIDTVAFAPRPDARESVRARWGIGGDVPVVGTVARLDPMKGYEDFLQAASRVARALPEACFLAVGNGPAGYTAELHALAASLGLEGRVIWAGRGDDVVTFYSAMDLFTLTSISEGFPNALGEAMACSLPCVVTDVGDAVRIVGSAGTVVPENSPEALAQGWLKYLAQSSAERHAVGQSARQRVKEEFSVSRMVEATEKALGGLLM